MRGQCSVGSGQWAACDLFLLQRVELGANGWPVV